jgi:hypothetical protein
MEANSNTMESGAQGLGKILLEISQLDHILALFVSAKGDLGVDRLGCRFGENSQLLMVLTTSLPILVPCVLFLVWRRGGSALSKPLEKSIPLVKEDEEDDSGKKKVTCFLWDSDRDSGRIFHGTFRICFLLPFKRKVAAVSFMRGDLFSFAGHRRWRSLAQHRSARHVIRRSIWLIN